MVVRRGFVRGFGLPVCRAVGRGASRRVWLVAARFVAWVGSVLARWRSRSHRAREVKIKSKLKK